MPNPGQTWIFYKVGQTQLTQAKCDPVDPVDPDDLTWLQCWYMHTYIPTHQFSEKTIFISQARASRTL